MRQKHRSPLELPDEIFRYRSGAEEIATEQTKGSIIEKIEWEKGVKLFFKGSTFFQKGLATPEAMWSINIAKRNFVEGLRTLTKWYFLPGTFIVFLSNKKRNELLRVFSSMSHRAVKPYIFRFDIMKDSAREIEWLSFRFLQNIGIDIHVSMCISEIIGVAFDYDIAYQLRLVDIMTETNKKNLIERPRKEIKYLISVIMQRETDLTIKTKLALLGKALYWLLLIPKYKKAFVGAVKEIDVAKLQYDDVDKFWACLRKETYNYMGLTNAERNKRRKELGWKPPKLIDIN